MDAIDLDKLARGVHSNKDLTKIYQEVSPGRIDILQDRILKVACPGCLSGVPEYFQKKGPDNPFLHKSIPNLSEILKPDASMGMSHFKHSLKR